MGNCEGRHFGTADGEELHQCFNLAVKFLDEPGMKLFQNFF